MHPVIADVTERIAARSAGDRTRYLDQIGAAGRRGPARGALGCANLAHGIAACGDEDKLDLRGAERPNVVIVSADNHMLSAHQPFERYPTQLKRAVGKAGGVARFAGGVPAMCDGITQGRSGMELSRFSREVVAMATAVALSHDAVVRHQGPRANGMPELHKLTPALGVLVDRGHQVALVTDGRMSGASGKVPAAIHCTPEAAAGGPLSRVADGDVVRLDATAGTLDVVGADLASRPPAPPPPTAPAIADGTGRDLFAPFRERVGRPDAGASVFGDGDAAPPHPFAPRLAGPDTLAA
jgi:dihydroxyacid dehydratase/phosphogluconate dehydratase